MDLRKRILSAGKFVRDRFIYGDHEQLVQEWVARKGDITLRLEYDFLTSDSLVFDLGGYCGQWASDIYAKYQCQVYVFEPVAQYAEFIRKRFHRNKRIRVFQFGLGNRSDDRVIKVSEEASSTYSKGADTRIRIEDFTAFVQKEAITDIDLMKVNIEGGEYDIVPYLVSTGYVARVRAIQIQFHEFVEEAKQRAETIRRGLEKTHNQGYSYDFVWEGWTRKDPSILQ